MRKREAASLCIVVVGPFVAVCALVVTELRRETRARCLAAYAARRAEIREQDADSVLAWARGAGLEVQPSTANLSVCFGGPGGRGLKVDGELDPGNRAVVR